MLKRSGTYTFSNNPLQCEALSYSFKFTERISLRKIYNYVAFNFRVRTNHQGMLLIEKALTKTAGSYTCIASNSKGVMYRNVYIDVSLI